MYGFGVAPRRRRLGWLASLTLALLVAAAPAFAQSASDKATARKLATEGIELFQAGKYAEALDKLNRAESMYDAPVHLLYIARAQSKLGQLVEATETYRRLVRVKLDAGAPQAFKDAIEAGKGELAALEPTIPSLRVDVTPQNVGSLEIVIDGEKVSAASVGIERPANPGKHEISVSAPGYEPASASVELKAAQKKNVALDLKALPGGPPPPGATPGTPGGPTPPADEAKPSDAPRGKLGFFAGLRLAGAVPAGVAYSNPAGEETNISDLFGPGGGGEIHGGVRFTKYLAATVFFEQYAFDPGSRLDDVPEYATNIASVDSTNVTTADGFGLGAIGGLMERGKLGGFGEASFLLLHRFTITRDVDDSELPDSPLGCDKTSDTLTLSGPALRIGGGAIIPLTDWLQLTPFMTATFSAFSESNYESGCPVHRLPSGMDARRIPLDHLPNGKSKLNVGGHQMFILGVGGDFLFGGP